MKKLFVHRTPHTLGVGLLLAIATMGANAQTVVGQTTALPLAPQAAPQPLAQPIARPAAQPGVVQSGVSPIGINQAPYSYNRPMDNVDESTLLSEAAKKQARLSLLNINAKIEQAQLALERDRMKFQEEQREAQSKAYTQQAQQNAAKGLTADGKKAQKEEEPEVKPSVRSIYSYDGKWFAEIVINGSKVLASPGTVLVGGGKVTSITSSNVVVVTRGQRRVLPLDGSAALSAQSVAPAAFTAPPTAVPSGPLPPIPPRN